MFWKKLKNRKKYKCPNCDEVHDELPALAFKTPYHYDIHPNDKKKTIAEISSDFCVINHPEQTDRFIRTTMTIKVNDACEDLNYGIWVSLSKKSFDDYDENFKNDCDSKTYFGMICNEIRDYKESTLGLHVNVVTRNGGIRPEIIPHKADHELINDWENGISIKEAEIRVDKLLERLGSNR
jgi:hypothetical protein